MPHISRTFSDLWYRVADFKPRLSPHLVVRRHTYRDTTWFVLGDPASSKFYRFNASAYRFLGLLDGRRTVDEAWDVCNAQLGDDAPTQTDCINLLSQLQIFGLLQNDLPIDPDRLRERIEKVREQRYKERVGNYVFFTIPLINPERILARFAHLARGVFSGWGLIALVALVTYALITILPRWGELSSSANNIIAPDNLILFTLSLLGLKVIHEFAHGFACKAYGGRVTEIGVFLMLLLPLPYCDATASWAFPSKWKRIMVSAAGMMAELAIASVAALVWAWTPPGLLHSLAFNIMFIASVVTVIFNLNPLLRYDGYYILADILEIPNMALRSHELLKWLTRRYLFGLKGEPAPNLASKSEAAWMILHAICAFPYRMLVVVGIVMFVADQYFIIGLLIAIFGGIMWFIVPIGKGLSYVLSEPSLQMVRVRAVATTFGAIALVVFFLGFVPLPVRVWATGVVEPQRMETLRAPYDGYLRDIEVFSGAAVESGERLMRIENPSLLRDYQKAEALYAFEEIRLSAATASSPTDRRLAEPLWRDAREQYQSLAEMRDEMDIVAEFSGTVVASELVEREGTYVAQGASLVTVAALTDPVVTAYIDDLDFALLMGADPSSVSNPDTRDEVERSGEDLIEHHTEVKLQSRVGEKISGRIVSVSSAGSREIRHPALTHQVAGGRISVDPSSTGQQQRQTQSIRPQWRVRVQLNEEDVARILNRSDSNASSELLALPGTRAVVRITLDSKPLAEQWWRRLRQLFANRFET